MGNFYEIAQALGFAFVTLGRDFTLISGVIGKRKINLFYLSLSAVLFAFGVLSRPTLAVYCICALIFIFAGLMKEEFLCRREKAESGVIYVYSPPFFCRLY